MANLPNLSARQEESLSPRRGLSTAQTGSAAVSPGTTLGMITLQVVNKKIVTLTPVVSPDTLYTIVIKKDLVSYSASFTSGPAANAATISAGITLAINNVMPANTVNAVDSSPDITLTSEVEGMDFSVLVTQGMISIAQTTPLVAPSSHVIKFWIHNAGSNPMIITQDGKAIMIVAAGTVSYEFIDPFGGDVAIIGDPADTFTAFATELHKNLRP